MATKKSEQAKAELAALKIEAAELGVTFPQNITLGKLQEKVDEAIGTRQAETTAAKLANKREDGGTKLNRIAVMRLKATNLRKVKITNMAQENAGSKTVFTSCHNMYIDMAKVVPLNKEIALEQALCDDIELNKKTLIDEPVLDKYRNETGNYMAVESPMYSIAYLDGK